MVKQMTKGITGYSKRMREEPASNNSTNNQQQSNYDKLIADMTKSFMESQTKTSESTNNNQEMLALLEKMSMQINELKNNLDNSVDSNGANSASNRSSEQPQPMKSQNFQELFSSFLQANSNDKTMQQNKEPNNDQTTQNNKAVQSAAQVLAQAQYELSNELEASLNKLRQVISKSEKIANKISGLLGNENNKQQ